MRSRRRAPVRGSWGKVKSERGGRIVGKERKLQNDTPRDRTRRGDNSTVRLKAAQFGLTPAFKTRYGEQILLRHAVKKIAASAEFARRIPINTK